MIIVKDLFKHYEKGLVKALNGVSFTVRKGECVAIVGPSGCGKTTLLNLIGALDVPTDGEIFVDGKNIREHRQYNRFRAEMVGFVFQLYHLIPSLTLLENVEIPMYSLLLSRKERKGRARRLLSEVGLEERMNFYPTRVSGGERQRAAIARALANEPKLVLADEPTGNVDTETGDVILDILTQLCRVRGITMLIATHDKEVTDRADRVIRIRNGLIEE
jgi:ABC-type lipoprotein export system ATPase subunit